MEPKPMSKWPDLEPYKKEWDEAIRKLNAEDGWTEYAHYQEKPGLNYHPRKRFSANIWLTIDCDFKLYAWWGIGQGEEAKEDDYRGWFDTMKEAIDMAIELREKADEIAKTNQ